MFFGALSLLDVLHTGSRLGAVAIIVAIARQKAIHSLPACLVHFAWGDWSWSLRVSLMDRPAAIV